jgi:hypothetical protein
MEAHTVPAARTERKGLVRSGAMFGLMVLVVIGSAVWVGFDASGRDFTTGKRWVMAKGPVGWVLGCLLLWIIFFPAYLAQRGRAPVKRAN